jgi:hypothetical protein
LAFEKSALFGWCEGVGCVAVGVVVVLLEELATVDDWFTSTTAALQIDECEYF